MKQFEFSYRDDTSFQEDLKKVLELPSCQRLFHLFSTSVNTKILEHVSEVIQSMDSSALITGCSTNGNIQKGRLQKEGLTVACTLFEDPSSRVEVISFPMNASNETETARNIVKAVNAREWVSAVEIYAVIRGISLTSFCHEMAQIRESVQIFGGGAFAEDINDNNACVLAGNNCRNRLAVILYGGNHLHIKASLVTGWKPLGRLMHVTKSDQNGRVYELDGKPAYDVYNHYLHIARDRSFFRNTLEFPFLYDNEGVSLLRAPVSCGEDGSLQMTSDMIQGSTARIAFGDPDHILSGIHKLGKQMEQFQPEGILLFSCAARRYFWGDDHVEQETLPFESLADTSGFFSSSEFLRQNGILQQHNVTLVTAVFREGDKKTSHHFAMKTTENSDERSVIARLARFVEVSTQELEEVNQLLAAQSITDGLTGLYNRMEIQRRMNQEIDHRKVRFVSLIMIDIDLFKKVNDTFGHKEGDLVLQCLSSLLKNQASYFNENASVGRWGGEEFMILLPGMKRQQAFDFAETLRTHFAECHYPHADAQTISLGVIECLPEETADEAATRVDQALYQAKKEGRNRTICL